MKKLLCIVIVLMLMTLTACSKSVISDEKTAKGFVENQGYKITTSKGKIHTYTLEKRSLYGGTETIPYQQAWGLQKIEPDMYFGKEISVYGFTVENHPLEKIYKQSKGANVFIMLSEGKVIGGYSYPNADVVGALSSLDGKTLEEVTGLTYKEWSENWKKKYGN